MAASLIDAPEDDPLRTYTPAEEARLTAQLHELTRAVHEGELRARPLALGLVEDLHHRLFEGVREHAGRIRDRGRGSERVTFGPHRSTHRDQVRAELDALFAILERKLRALDDADDAVFDGQAIEVAVWLHAEIIRIHPFEDGNGRTSRPCANHLLVRAGLRPVAMEAVKQEYTEALNHYYVQRDIEPLVDLYLGLYPVDR